MKNVISFAERSAARARTPNPASGTASTEQAEENPVRLPDKPKFPPRDASAHVEISDEGRRILARMAQRTENELYRQPAEETIELLVAEGIEEGFLA